MSEKEKLLLELQDIQKVHSFPITRWNDFLFSLQELAFIVREKPLEKAKIRYLIDLLIKHCDTSVRGLSRLAMQEKRNNYLEQRDELEFPGDLLDKEFHPIFDIEERNLDIHILHLVKDISSYITTNFKDSLNLKITSRKVDYSRFREGMVKGEYEISAIIIRDWMRKENIREISLQVPSFVSITLKQIERYVEKTKDLNEHVELGLITEMDKIRMRQYVFLPGLPVKLFPNILFDIILR